MKANMGCGKMIVHVIMAKDLESTRIEVHKLFTLNFVQIIKKYVWCMEAQDYMCNYKVKIYL
jgi:hypothetical protein